MAENLKRFFKKKKIDLTFKKAGPGQRLNEETKKSVARVEEPTFSRVEQSAEAKQAAAAALARLQGPSTTSAGFSKPSLYNKVKNEVSQELKSSTKSSADFKPTEPVKRVAIADEVYPTRYATSGVYFRCPLIGDEILTKTEWKTKIREYLYGQLESEKGLIACLILRNCNKNPDKINSCVETLSKYLRNIVNNPDEEKYQKIRVSNKVFQERIAGMEGAFEFLEAAGFTKQQLDVQGGSEEFLVISKEKAKDVETLEMLADALNNAETITLELDRNVQVLLPSQAESRTQLPDDFFRYTPEELKKEQQTRTETLESVLALRTKAMRDKQEQKEMKKYRYALIRVRFPDGILLQGTFSVHEKYEEVHKFVEENLNVNCDFSLVIAEIGRSFSQEDFDKTLFELHLVPATVLLFHCNSSLPSDESMLSYLKPDIAVLLQNL